MAVPVNVYLPVNVSHCSTMVTDTVFSKREYTLGLDDDLGARGRKFSKLLLGISKLTITNLTDGLP